MKASPRQAGLLAGASGQAAEGFRGRAGSHLSSSPLVSLCVGGRSQGEWVRGGGVHRRPRRKKVLKHQVLGSQIASPEKSVFVSC